MNLKMSNKFLKFSILCLIGSGKLQMDQRLLYTKLKLHESNIHEIETLGT